MVLPQVAPPIVDSDVLWRFAGGGNQLSKEDGVLRANSILFYGGTEPTSRISLFHSGGCDQRRLVERFPRRAIFAVTVSDVRMAGFELEETPADGLPLDRHLELVPDAEWTGKEHRRRAKALALCAVLHYEPEDLAS